jgi:hypothetical protein
MVDGHVIVILYAACKLGLLMESYSAKLQVLTVMGEIIGAEN